jgi:hypothetical protein
MVSTIFYDQPAGNLMIELFPTIILLRKSSLDPHQKIKRPRSSGEEQGLNSDNRFTKGGEETF